MTRREAHDEMFSRVHEKKELFRRECVCVFPYHCDKGSFKAKKRHAHTSERASERAKKRARNEENRVFSPLSPPHFNACVTNADGKSYSMLPKTSIEQ